MTAITDFVFQFTLQGLMIIARNYLDVYPYDRWNAKVVIHCIFVYDISYSGAVSWVIIRI